MSATGFMDDINILTYSESTEQNCLKLAEIHKKCQSWAGKHGSKFCPDKYELIHFSRTKKKFNMSAEIKLGDQSIGPKSDIRILGVRLDSALRWQAHMRAIKAKSVHIISALRMITGSTWGSSLETSKEVYKTAIRPAITYAASIWHTPHGVKGHRKGIGVKLQKIQGKCLRTIAGAYKATSTEALEIETFTPPLDLHTERLATRAIARIRMTKAATGIKKMCKQICRQTTGKRGRTATPRSSPADRTNTWADQFTSEPQEAQQTNKNVPPWEKNQEPRHNKRLSRLYEGLTSHYNERWKDRWKSGKKGAHSRNLWSHPTERTIEAHMGLKKHESALLTQLRTGKIGFNAFLYEMKVPNILSPNCDCPREESMTVEHILLNCPKWSTEREELIHPLRTTDIKEILTSKRGAKAAIRMIQRTKILDQFKRAVDQDIEQRLRDENREEEEVRMEEEE